MRLTKYFSVGDLVFKLNVATVLSVLGLLVKAFYDYRSQDWNAFVTDLGAILTAIGIPSIFPTPPPPASISRGSNVRFS